MLIVPLLIYVLNDICWICPGLSVHLVMKWAMDMCCVGLNLQNLFCFRREEFRMTRRTCVVLVLISKTYFCFRREEFRHDTEADGDGGGNLKKLM